MDAGNLQLLEKLDRVKLQCCLESSFLVFVKLYEISILIAAPPAPDLMYESSLGYTAIEAPLSPKKQLVQLHASPRLQTSKISMLTRE